MRYAAVSERIGGQRLENEQRRREMISGVSHDLRTPLTSIGGYLDGLMDRIADTPEKRKRYLNAIKTRTKDLERLVDSLSEYNRLESGRVKYHMEYEDLKVFFEQYLSAYRDEIHPQSIDIGNLSIIPKERRVTVKGQDVTLTNKEFELLLFFAENPNIVFSKTALYDRIWGMDAMGDTATVTVHINRLREKIEKDPASPQLIETVWGAGYRMKL